MAPLRCHSTICGEEATASLDSIKATFSTVSALRMTRTAQNTAFSLGLTLQDVVTSSKA